MDFSMLAALLCFLWVCFYLLKPSPITSSKGRLPPGPKPLPIIGNLHELGNTPHRYLANIAKTYGPLMSLKFGSITTIVISSSVVAKELFQTHDITVSTRKVPAAVRANGHDKFSVAWLPVCPKWRNLRKISAIHLFSTQRLDGSQSLRHEKVVELLDYVKGCCKGGEAVDVGEAAFTTSLNLLSNTFFSFDLASYSSATSGEFKELVWRIMEEIGKPNLSDCFPLLRFVGALSVNRQLLGYGNKLNEVFAEIIKKRLSSNRFSDSASEDDDVLNTLLRLMKEDDSELGLDDIKHLLMV